MGIEEKRSDERRGRGGNVQKKKRVRSGILKW